MELNDDEDEHADGLDPTKLDPIAAAMYVSQMYEKEATGGRKMQRALEDSSSASENSDSDESMTLYPKPIFDKMKKFYSVHDPAKLQTIGIGTKEVDEEKLDSELKAKFGVGLASVG
jgi:hypothetical protein